MSAHDEARATALADLTALIETCRAAGLSHFEGSVPPLNRHNVKLGIRPVAPSAPTVTEEPATSVEPPAKPASPLEAELNQAIALEKRLFGG